MQDECQALLLVQLAQGAPQLHSSQHGVSGDRLRADRLEQLRYRRPPGTAERSAFIRNDAEEPGHHFRSMSGR